MLVMLSSTFTQMINIKWDDIILKWTKNDPLIVITTPDIMPYIICQEILKVIIVKCKHDEKLLRT
jgi:hypothetical protein